MTCTCQFVLFGLIFCFDCKFAFLNVKSLKIFLLSFITIAIVAAAAQYFFCPQYSFPEPSAFEGQQLYNPYKGIDTSFWRKCNFHAHSNVWMGITNGQGNADSIWKRYASFGYSVNSVSDYQKINTAFNNKENYISAYEHGYNIRKTHQLVIGSNQVKWLDYLFPQTLSNKQQVINTLNGSDSVIVILNHPGLRKGYSPDELRYLDNYHFMEVLNPSVFSFSEWDAALSAGKPVFIVGNDDTHNINNPLSIGRECTWLNLKKVNRKNILDALKKGKGYGMHIASEHGEQLTERLKRERYNLPFLKNLMVVNDTIRLLVSQPAKSISFIGQGGKLLSKSLNTNSAYYIIKKKDHYVRTAIIFEDSTAIYLNPVFRYVIDPFKERKGAQLNVLKTNIFRAIGIFIFIVWIIIFGSPVVISFIKRNKKRKYSGTGGINTDMALEKEQAPVE